MIGAFASPETDGFRLAPDWAPEVVMTVPARVSLITLGVADLDRSTDFYQALGWPLSSASVVGTVSFFRTGGAVLALWGRDDLAADATVDAAATSGFRAVALAINLDTPEDVDAALQQAAAAGARLVKPPHTADWGGYSGYFADPDEHLWEVATTPSGRSASTGDPSCPDAGRDLGERQPEECQLMGRAISSPSSPHE
jgi:catechol 2,3-dioxygenase-like lactoylglutathione lyase family enzyme